MRVALIAAVAFAVRLWGLLQTAEPVGYDGYYYVVQAQTWWATGQMHAPDSSWVLRFLALCAVGDPIVGIKVGSAILAALCVPAVWFQTRSYGACCWIAASACVSHLAGDFPKQLGAVAPAILFCACFSRRRWLLALLFATLAATAHKSGAIVVLLFAIAYNVRYALPVVLLLFVVALVATNALHWTDVDRFAPEWPQLDRPWIEMAEWCLPLFALRRRGYSLLPLVSLLERRLMIVSPLLTVPRLPWIVIVLAPFIEQVERKADITPNYQEMAEAINAMPETPTLLIAPQGFSFYYHYKTGREAIAWEEGDARIVKGLKPHEWTGFEAVALPHGYSYWKEDEYERFREQVVDSDVEQRLQQNPNRKRPESLRRNHRE